MKARKWFFALGQSHEARGMRGLTALGLDEAPDWAMLAYNAGRLSVQCAGFGQRLSGLSTMVGRSFLFGDGVITIQSVTLGHGPYTFRATPEVAENMVQGRVSFDYGSHVPGDKGATASGHARGVAGKSEGVS